MTEDAAKPADEPIEDLDLRDEQADGVAGGATMVEMPAAGHGGAAQDPQSGLPTGQ